MDSMKNPHSIWMSVFALWMIFLPPSIVNAQDADYSFVGETVYLVDDNQDTLNSGMLLQDQFLNFDQIKKATVRYDSDTLVTNSDGSQDVVQRLFDLYTPKDEYSFIYEGGQINKLPVMIMLHAGSGDKETVADHAWEWAYRGYAVITPTYRTDRLGVEYCHTYTKSIYLAAQDLSAVVRFFSFLYDDSQLEVPNIENNILIGEPIDGHSIFFAGKSFGGTAALHTVSRLVQEQWEDYLGSDDPYVVEGEQGSLDIGDSGPLHSTGRNSISNYEYPFDRIKGAICRTAGILSAEQLDYSTSPNKVPVCFVIGTCDKIVPYVSRTVSGEDEEALCNANITFPDGTQANSFTAYGPSYISQVMQEADVYNEVITFCGGGHDTNNCVDDIIESRTSAFATRVLTGDYVEGEVLDIVYRYQMENYSNQCCEIEDDYAYIDKCDCSDDNPYDPIELDLIEINGCSFLNECGLGSICDLVPLSDGFIEPFEITSNITLVKCESGVCLQFSSVNQRMLEFSYFSEEGKSLFKTNESVYAGVNRISLPEELPTDKKVILQIEGYRPIQFYLRAE